jgi:hypothetical protein
LRLDLGGGDRPLRLGYKTGLLTPLFLNLLHIFLEFPLNYHTLTGIRAELGSRLRLGVWTR